MRRTPRQARRPVRRHRRRARALRWDGARPGRPGRRAVELHQHVHRDGDPRHGDRAEQPAGPGRAGATGTFDYRINSDEEVICYDLRLEGVTGEYQSPARTATHIHEAASGVSGPPRIAFPNPEGDGEVRTSSGCLKGPFTTGVMANGQDSGTGFSLKQIEANPSAFFGDTHTAGYTAGTVRGQLTPVPMGGVETGAGGADAADAAPIALGAAAVLAAGAAGAVAYRRVAG